MKYGCIGEKLGHSFSKEIHEALADYEYELCEIPRDQLSDFAKRADFSAVNVTIPYKELIMKHMDCIDPLALEVGAVNTVVNRGGKLYGYNTDFYGMTMLARHAGVSMSGKKVAILGTGGTSKTAAAVAKSLGAQSIIRVSRTAREGAVTYADLYENHTDTEVIINTTPVGMFPNGYDLSVDISKFKNLTGALDAVYNPLRTPFILSARQRKIAAEGGLYMLVSQAVRASEIFTDKKYPQEALDCVYKRILASKENIVLTGMPASGKSTVGKLLAKDLGRKLFDTDTLIEEREGKTIPEIFAQHGEGYFRELEAEVIKDVSKKVGIIVSTGGGAVLREENVNAMRSNGRIYFIDRPLTALIPTSDRPLASTKEAIMRVYNERYGIYKSTADTVIDADCDAVTVAEKIKGSQDK